MNLNNLPELRTFRKELRVGLTPAEAKLWSMIKGSALQGRNFRRQHSFSSYILDFYCSSEKLGIELDGEGHFNERAAQYNHERGLFLEFFGIKIIRFENRAVFESPKWVLEKIQSNFGWNSKMDRFVDHVSAIRPIYHPVNGFAAATPPLEGGELLLDYLLSKKHLLNNGDSTTVLWQFRLTI